MAMISRRLLKDLEREVKAIILPKFSTSILLILIGIFTQSVNFPFVNMRKSVCLLQVTRFQLMSFALIQSLYYVQFFFGGSFQWRVFYLSLGFVTLAFMGIEFYLWSQEITITLTGVALLIFCNPWLKNL